MDLISKISELAGQTAARLARGDSLEFNYGWDDYNSAEPATEGAAAVAAATDATPEMDDQTSLVEPLTKLTLQEEPEESVPPSPALVREPSAKTAMLSVAGLDDYYSVLVHDLQVDSKTALLNLTIERFTQAVRAAKLTLPYRKRLLFLGLQQDIRLTSDLVTPTPSSDGDCAVCFSSSAECELIVLKCGETICHSCLQTALATQIGEGRRPRCPFYSDCKQNMSPDEVDLAFGDACPLCFLSETEQPAAAAAAVGIEAASSALGTRQHNLRDSYETSQMIQIPCVFDHRFCLRCLRKYAERCLQRKEQPRCPRHAECRHFLEPDFLEREIFVIDEDSFSSCPFVRGYVKPSVFNAQKCPDILGYVRKSIFNSRCRNCDKSWKSHSPNIFHTRCQRCMRPLRDHTSEKETVAMINKNTRLLNAYHDLRLSHAANEHRFKKECGNPKCRELVTLPLSLVQVRQTQNVSPCVCTACRSTWCSRCWQPFHYNVTCEEAAKHTSIWFGFLQSQREQKLGARTEEAFRNYEALRADEALKAKNCRLCPNCGLIVWRTDGCNRVTCGADARDKGGKVHLTKGCRRVFDWSKAEPYKPQVEFHPPSCESNILRPKGDHMPAMLCSCCSNLISGTFFSCIHCHRGTVKATSRTCASPARQVRSNKWACSACTFLNNQSQATCEICRTRKPPPPVRPARSTSLQEGKDDGVSLCRTCMFTLLSGSDPRATQRADVLSRHAGHVFRIMQPPTPDELKALQNQKKKQTSRLNFFHRLFGKK